MKKRFLILAIGLVLLCSLFTGCEFFDHGKTDTSDRTMEFPEELKTRVLEDYLIYSGIQSDKKPDEIEYEFCGSYGDSTAIYFHTSGAYETPVNEEIAGYRFTYPDSRVIKIWNGGKFYKMSEALELGLINEDNVETIHTSFENIEFSEPYFIYECKNPFDLNWHERYLYSTMINGMHPGMVEVVIDEGISRHQKEFDSSYFAGIDIDYIEETSPYKDRSPEELPKDYPDGYYQSFVIHLKDKTDEAVLDAIAILEKIDGITGASPCYILTGIPDYQFAVNDPYYLDGANSVFTENDQWALDNIDIEKVWDFTVGVSYLKVGIIDSGIASHPDLNANYLDLNSFKLKTDLDFRGEIEDEIPVQYSADIDSHGTHIAGIIGGVGNNSTGISGINHNVTLIQLRIASAFLNLDQAYLNGTLVFYDKDDVPVTQ